MGSSNGAALAHRLAANAGPDLPIKGIVADVTQLLSSPARSGPGSLNYNQSGRGSSPVSVMSVMGTSDPLIPYLGGSSRVFDGDDAFRLHSALDSMAVWAEYNSCAGADAPQTSVGTWSQDGRTGMATKFVYGGCPNGLLVEHYEIEGGEHGSGGVSIDGVGMKCDLTNAFIDRVEEGAISDPPCEDTNENCELWASLGECDDNPLYMVESCTRACDACETVAPAPAPARKVLRGLKK